MAEVGARVLAILGVKGDTVQSFGEGVYAGRFRPPENAIGFNLAMENHRIDLDSGKSVFGCECWWGSVETMRDQLKDYTKWELLDIDVLRQERQAQQQATQPKEAS